MESPQTRDGTRVPCTGRRILNHWTTREVLILRFSNSVASAFIFASPSTCMHWRRKWQPTPVFLPGESQGRGSLVGCGLWSRTELDTTEATWQQQLLPYFPVSILCLLPNFSAVWLINSFSFFLSIKIIFRTSSPGSTALKGSLRF